MNLPSEISLEVGRGHPRDLTFVATFQGRTVEAAAARAAKVLRETADWLERVVAFDETLDPARDRLELGS